jgi:hypothetical protein
MFSQCEWKKLTTIHGLVYAYLSKRSRLLSNVLTPVQQVQEKVKQLELDVGSWI